MKSANYKTMKLDVPAQNIAKSDRGFFDTIINLYKEGKSIFAIDGYPLTRWGIINNIVSVLKENNFNVIVFNFFDCYKGKDLIWDIIKNNIICDKHFGRIFDGSIEDFIDPVRVEELKILIKKSNKNSITIIYGCGLLNKYTKNLFNALFYFDLTREKFLERIKNEKLSFLSYEKLEKGGSADVGLSVDIFKLIQYIIYPIFDKYRRVVIKKMDFYIDSSVDFNIIPATIFTKILSELTKMPLILKTLYIGGPWGGNWIKEIRKLPTSFKNCAWAFDAVANDLSIPVQLNGFEMDIPFNTLLALERKSLMGIKASKRYGFFWPVRVHYDDSFNGGNMALQVHPDQNYVKTHFNEKIGQYEAYYILKAKDNTKVYLGLKDDADVNEFYRQAALSRDSKKVFQYEKFVNCMESATGDLFLIPAGTIHSLGKGQVCLEIGTNYGYTFHIYDYVRPSLNGSLREIHLEQAFNVLNTKMRAALVKTKLKQNPVIIKKLSNMTEKVLGKIKGVPFEVRLIEFTKSYSNSPAGKFHILSLIDGEKATIECSNKKIDLFFTDTVIIPASVKDYRITADGSAKILKVLLKD